MCAAVRAILKIEVNIVFSQALYLLFIVYACIIITLLIGLKSLPSCTLRVAVSIVNYKRMLL